MNCLGCISNPYKLNMCKDCYLTQRYHCTWPNCVRPVFTLTLCRSHYRQINVKCAHEDCERPSYCKQVCAHHYRKKELTAQISCEQCSRPMYMHNKCFYHFTCRTCQICNDTVFSKQMCRKHYMRHYRNQRFLSTGPTTNNENTDELRHATPDTKNHIPVTQSSREQSDI